MYKINLLLTNDVLVQLHEHVHDVYQEKYAYATVGMTSSHMQEHRVLLRSTPQHNNYKTQEFLRLEHEKVLCFDNIYSRQLPKHWIFIRPNNQDTGRLVRCTI